MNSMELQKILDDYANKIEKTNYFLKDTAYLLRRLQEYKEEINDENFSKLIKNNLIEAINKIV